jgi:hypothetical protein
LSHFPSKRFLVLGKLIKLLPISHKTKQVLVQIRTKQHRI